MVIFRVNGIRIPPIDKMNVNKTRLLIPLRYSINNFKN